MGEEESAAAAAVAAVAAAAAAAVDRNHAIGEFECIDGADVNRKRVRCHGGWESATCSQLLATRDWLPAKWGEGEEERGRRKRTGARSAALKSPQAWNPSTKGSSSGTDGEIASRANA
ncbi:hypothetical protein CLOP_g12498 [Closterium sp. NIES-67]|nr:hypothetical protein CLOP_g12498 [Closterium sp. NIES-67]